MNTSPNTVVASLDWQGGQHYHCRNRELVTSIDASLEHGGENKGPTPKELILNAMMGCTAMDVTSMFQKMRQTIESFHVKVEAQKNNSHPIYYKKYLLFYHLKGEIAPEKAIKAVVASLTKYCGVNYMLSKSGHIGYELWLNDALIQTGETAFIDPVNDEDGGA